MNKRLFGFPASLLLPALALLSGLVPPAAFEKKQGSTHGFDSAEKPLGLFFDFFLAGGGASRIRRRSERLSNCQRTRSRL